LADVTLVDVPVWACQAGHQELELPAVEQLQRVLAELVIRRSTPLTGPDLRFLRGQLGLTSRQMARRIGVTAVHLSRLERGHRPVPRPLDLLVRLYSACSLAAANGANPVPLVTPLLEELESPEPASPSLRVRHTPRNNTRGAGWVRD
jgi:transcriptional regulator with XRE-family HTH domain